MVTISFQLISYNIHPSSPANPDLINLPAGICLQQTPLIDQLANKHQRQTKLATSW